MALPPCETEDGSRLMLRLGEQPEWNNLFPWIFCNQINRGDVIEINGNAGVGKTELLLNLISKLILPKALNGLDCGVVLIDTDRNFDLIRLVVILESHLTKFDLSDSQNKSDRKELIRSYLEKVLIFQPSDSAQFTTTLCYLDELLINKKGMSVLMVDSISNYYFLDRMLTGDNTNAFRSQQRARMELFKKLLANHNLTLFVTKQVLFNRDQKDEGNWNDFLGWDNFVTISLELKRDLETNYVSATLLKKSYQHDSKFVINSSGINEINLA